MSKTISECTALVKLRCWLSRPQAASQLTSFRNTADMSFAVKSIQHIVLLCTCVSILLMKYWKYVFPQTPADRKSGLWKTVRQIKCRLYSHWQLWAWDKQRDICSNLKLRFCCSAHAVELRTGRAAMHILRVLPVPAASSLPVLGL